MEEVEELLEEAGVLKTNPEFESRRDFAVALGDLLEEEQYGTITACGNEAPDDV